MLIKRQLLHNQEPYKIKSPVEAKMSRHIAGDSADSFLNVAERVVHDQKCTIRYDKYNTSVCLKGYL